MEKLHGGIKLPKIPAHILNNFIYRNTWERVYEKDGNAGFMFLGDVGSGKSWAALRFCQDLDPEFSADNVVFSLEDYLKLLNSGKLKKGSAILFDEIAGSEEGADSRSSLSKTNKTMSYIATTTRVKGYIVCYSSPMLSQIDKNIRKIGIVGFIVMNGFNKRKGFSRGKFYWKQMHAIADIETKPFPVLSSGDGDLIKVKKIQIYKPDLKITRAYDKKKLAFVDSNLIRWEDKVKGVKEPNKNEVKISEMERLKIIARTLRDLDYTWKQIGKKVKRSERTVMKWDLDMV